MLFERMFARWLRASEYVRLRVRYSLLEEACGELDATLDHLQRVISEGWPPQRQWLIRARSYLEKARCQAHLAEVEVKAAYGRDFYSHARMALVHTGRATVLLNEAVAAAKRVIPGMAVVEACSSNRGFR